MTRPLVRILAGLVLAVPVCASPAWAAPPNPVLYLTGQEPYATGGQEFVRYRYDVFNKAEFPAEMFAPSPGLPPCGSNANSARTWVDFYDSRGKRLQGFCALGGSQQLSAIWFSLVTGEIPPSWIYIELNDRLTNTKYKSNLAETTN